MATKFGSGQIDKKDDLMYNFSLGQGSSGMMYHGYKREFITQPLSPMEETLTVCSMCSGILRDACNIREGVAMVCEACVGMEEEAQPVGAVRSMVSNLNSRCPLKHRGCKWEGTIGEMAQHLDECEHLIVKCPFSIYGCGIELKREEFEIHRKEGKDYHNELMGIFMAERVEGQAEEIKKLQQSINELIEERRYQKINGVVWKINECENIKDKILQFTTPSEVVSFDLISSEGACRSMKKKSTMKQTIYKGPKFVLGVSYVLTPQLLIDHTSEEVSINLISDKTNVNDKTSSWPLHGKCKVVILNQENANADWVLETDGFELYSKGAVKLTSLPSCILSDEQYNKDGAIVMKLLFEIEQ